MSIAAKTINTHISTLRSIADAVQPAFPTAAETLRDIADDLPGATPHPSRPVTRGGAS